MINSIAAHEKNNAETTSAVTSIQMQSYKAVWAEADILVRIIKKLK